MEFEASRRRLTGFSHGHTGLIYIDYIDQAQVRRGVQADVISVWREQHTARAWRNRRSAVQHKHKAIPMRAAGATDREAREKAFG